MWLYKETEIAMFQIVKWFIILVSISPMMPVGRAAKKKKFPPASCDSRCMKKFSVLSVAEKKRQIRDDAYKLDQLLRLRAARGGSDQWRTLVVFSSGGGGHKSAAQSIQSVLTDYLNELSGVRSLFDVKKVEPFIVSADRWNQAMANEDAKKIRTLVHLKSKLDHLYDTPIGRFQLHQEMQRVMVNPDLVLHNVHLGTEALRKTALHHGAQFRLIPTDYSVNMFVHDVKGANSSQDLSFRADLALDLPNTRLKMEKHRIKNWFIAGYPARLEFLDIAERLQSEEKEVSLQAQSEIDLFLEQRNIDLDRDRVIFIMMGGARISGEKIFNLVSTLARFSQKLVKNGGKLHVFHAQAMEVDPVTKQATLLSANFIRELSYQLERFHHSLSPQNSFRYYPLGWLDAKEIAYLMTSGVTICKGGGGTVAELVSTGGQAVFDMTVSNSLEWEKFSVNYMQEHGWGEGLDDLSDEQQVILALARAFEKKENRNGIPSVKNHFHLDWLKSVLVDTVDRLEFENNEQSS